MADIMVFGTVISAADVQALRDLAVLPPDSNIRYTVTSTSTLSISPSAWANPLADRSSKNPRATSIKMVDKPDAIFALTMETNDPKVGSSSVSDFDIGISYFLKSSQNWTAPVPLVRKMTSDSKTDKSAILLACGSNHDQIVAIWSSNSNYLGNTGLYFFSHFFSRQFPSHFF